MVSNTKALTKEEEKTSAKECHTLPIFNRKAKTGQHHNILDHFLRFLTKFNCTQLKQINHNFSLFNLAWVHVTC